MINTGTPMRVSTALAFFLLVLGSVEAQETRPILPPPSARPLPATLAEAETRLAELRAFLVAEEPRVASDKESIPARRVARVREQTVALQRLIESRRAAVEDAAEAASSIGDRDELFRRLEEVRRAETAPPAPARDSDEDPESAIKIARDAAEADAKSRKTERERLLREIAKQKAIRDGLKAELADREKEAADLRSDLEAERSDARDYLAAGLDPDVVMLKEEAVRLLELQSADAETRAASRRRLAEGLLDQRIGLLELRSKIEESLQKGAEARSAALEVRAAAALEARLERARSEAGEIDRILAQAPEWAKPYWRFRRALVEVRVEQSNFVREGRVWSSRHGSIGEIAALAADAEAESKALEDVDAAKFDVYELVPQDAEALTTFIATHQAELDRVRVLFEEARKAKASLRAAARGLRVGGAEILPAAAESARRAAIAPPDIGVRPWFERESVQDAKWAELVEALRKASTERATAVDELERALAEATVILARTRALRERNLLRYQSALRWTREGAEISFEAVERAIDDAKLAPGYVRRRTLGMADRTLAFWGVLVASDDRSSLLRAGAALVLALALLVLAARSLPRLAETLEGRRGVGRGAAFLLLLSALLLRRTVFTGLLAFCATALPSLLGAPETDVRLLAVLFVPPFVFRTLRVLCDVLLGREPAAPVPYRLHPKFEAVAHATLRRLLQIGVLFVPPALLLTVEGYEVRNAGFVDLLWLCHALSSYAVVLVVALRPRQFLSDAAGETGLRARLKAAIFVAYPVFVAAVIFLIVLRSLGYTVAVKYFLRQFVETAAWFVGATWLLRRVRELVFRGATPVPPPATDPAADEGRWTEEGRGFLFDRTLRFLVLGGVVVPAAWFVLQLWGLTGAGYDAVFGRPVLGSSAAVGGAAVAWSDVINATATTFLAFHTVRFVRDLLRFVLLPKTSLDTGLRYTIVTLVTYLLTAIAGVVVLGGQLKVEAAVIGGFVAALGVGLGFGLKEIVDNFFSGVILLVERPVKVGDVVAVGQTVGRVDRINMRSTTIMTGDNKGLIVPNKDLISQQVTNWSAGTPTIRTSMRIGIDYAADAQLFRKTALETLDQFGLVLKSPGPEVLFRAFGGSALEFEIFYWIRLSTNGMRLQSDILFALDIALKQHGISIPFPRQDVVIHPSSELGIRRAGPPSTAAEAPSATSTPYRRRTDEPGASRYEGDDGVATGD